MKGLVAGFDDAASIVACAGRARAAGFVPRDALTPYPVDALADALEISARSPLRVRMALAGFGVAAAFFAFETWSAVLAYPVNEGGRPLFSWPPFLLSPFEIGILAAAIVGFGCFLLGCGLPRLHHPLFDVPGIERASADRFFLVFDPVDRGRTDALRGLLFEAGAAVVSEAET